jgi:lysophospholipase L1-like esterase
MSIKHGNHLRQRYLDVLIGIGVTFLFILIIEIGARSYFYTVSCQACIELGRRDHHFFPGGYGDLYPNQDGIWTVWPHRPYHVETNDLGLRHAWPLNESNSLRILAIGDSFTFGPYVTNEDTWPGWLQSILRQRLNRDDIEVLNAGIGGYTIEDQIAYFRDKGHVLAPDIVILAFYVNDISDFRPSQRREFRRPAAEIVQTNNIGPVREFLRDYVAVYKLASVIKKQIQIAAAQSRIDNSAGPLGQATQTVNRVNSYDILYYNPNSPEYLPYYEQYEATLREFTTELEATDARLVIVAFPEYIQIPPDAYPDSPQQFLRRVTEKIGNPYLDLLPALRTTGEIEDLYLLAYDIELEPDLNDPFFVYKSRYVGNGHMSRFGYRMAAQAIADFLLNQNLLSLDTP